MENLQRLRVLRAVARHGSFTAAGAALALSQPAVSQHIAVLERQAAGWGSASAGYQRSSTVLWSGSWT